MCICICICVYIYIYSLTYIHIHLCLCPHLLVWSEDAPIWRAHTFWCGLKMRPFGAPTPSRFVRRRARMARPHLLVRSEDAPVWRAHTFWCGPKTRPLGAPTPSGVVQTRPFGVPTPSGVARRRARLARPHLLVWSEDAPVRRAHTFWCGPDAVSYTHLTLPTILRV